MIGNISRLHTFLTCRQKEYNQSIYKLRPLRDDANLIFGGGVHKGAEAYFKLGDRAEASSLAEQAIKVRYEGSLLLPEEIPLIEKYAMQGRSATTALADFFAGFSDFQVIMPEVRFCVELPGTIHHCRFAHALLFPQTPFECCDYNWYNIHPPIPDRSNVPPCHIPHYLAGRTDGVCRWNGMLWLLELKTTSDLTEGYFIQWVLSFQPTGYVYGVQKATGIPVHGFVLVKIEKPRKNAKDAFHFGISAEPIPKTPEDLADFERDISHIMTDYEETMFDPSHIYKNPQACRDYNRTCMFHSMCTGHRPADEREFRLAGEDYVDLYLKEKLGLLTKEEVEVQLTQQEEALYAISH